MGGKNMSVTVITNENFKQEVLQANQKVLVDFWAPWCGPCRMLSPIVDEIAETPDLNFKVGKINVDEQPDLAEKYGVFSIPTLVVFDQGEVVNTSVGVIGKQEIMDLLQ